MSDLTALLKEWLPSVASVATLGAAIRIAWLSKTYLDDLATARRVGLLVEGDPKEHHDERKRGGLLRRLEKNEEVSAATSGALGKLTAPDGPVGRLQWQMKATLRGMRIPSDLSDEHELEAKVKARVQGGALDVDTTGARRELVEEQSRRFSPPADRPQIDPAPALRRRPTAGTAWRGKPPDDEGDGSG